MAYAPIGVQADANKMAEERKKMQDILDYLSKNPTVTTYMGYTKETAQAAIERIDGFKFYE